MDNTNKDIFKVGDFVIIKQDNSDLNTLGKIEEIFEEDGNLLFRYNEYYFPEKTQEPRKEHHSKYEVFKTNEIEKEYFNRISKKCEIMKYDQFIRKMQIVKEKQIQNAHLMGSFLENLFFYRQIYNASDNSFYPEIEPSCFCNKIFNPDKPFITCSECKELIHTECFIKSDSKNCFKCSNNLNTQLKQNGIAINLDNFETYFIKQNSSNNINSSNINSFNVGENLLGNKRARTNSFDDKTNIIEANSINKKSVKEIDFNEEANNKNNIKVNDKNKTTVNNLIESGIGKIKSANEEKTSYPNLSEDRRKYLTSLIEKLESSNNSENADKRLSTEEKSRRTFRNKISYALLYGIEELKETGDWEKVKTKELKNQNINPITAIKFCNNTAIAIESAIFYNNGESIQGKTYKNKYKTLLLNLMDPRNPELRFSILNGDITATELVKLSSEQLAPSRIKNMRTERQNKYFKEQVLMKEEMKVIVKTHKGESILNVDSNASDNENDNSKENESNLNESSFNQEHFNEKSAKKEFSVSNANKNDFSKANKANNNKETNNTEKITKSENFANKNASLIAKVNSKINKDKEFKYKKLNQEMQDFCKLLDDYSRDNLIHKLNEKLRTNLNPVTYNQIKQLEAKLSNS